MPAPDAHDAFHDPARFVDGLGVDQRRFGLRVGLVHWGFAAASEPGDALPDLFYSA